MAIDSEVPDFKIVGHQYHSYQWSIIKDSKVPSTNNN